MFRYSDYDATAFEPALPSPDCTLIAPLLTAYFDLEAPGVEAMRVQQHLSGCARCAQMWRDWGDARWLLQTTHTPAPPHTLAATIVQTSRLIGLLPTAPLTNVGLANRHDVTVVPPQLQDAIFAATTRAPITTRTPVSTSATMMNDAVVMQHDFSQRLRRAKPLAAMALVPTLALWLITLAANHSTFLATAPAQQPATAPSANNSAPAMSRVSSLENAELMIASPKNPTAQPANALPQKPVMPRALEATESTPVSTSADANDAARQIQEAPANPVALAQWSPSKTGTLAALATPLSAYSVQPIAGSPLPTVRARVTAVKTVKAAFVPQKGRVTRTAAPQTPRRRARLSTVAMTTPAALAWSLTAREAKSGDEMPRGETLRLAMKSDAPLQKAMLPIASSRDSEESLWQSDLATDGSALSVVQALNDNRPRELRDAFDAYAKTLIDDSDGMAATL